MTTLCRSSARTTPAATAPSTERSRAHGKTSISKAWNDTSLNSGQLPIWCLHAEIMRHIPSRRYKIAFILIGLLGMYVTRCVCPREPGSYVVYGTIECAGAIREVARLCMRFLCSSTRRRGLYCDHEVTYKLRRKPPRYCGCGRIATGARR